MILQMRFIRSSAIVATLLFAATVAMAQNTQDKSEPRAPAASDTTAGIGGMGGVRLLRSEQIQQELKLTDPQKAQIEELLEKIRQDLRSRVKEVMQLSGDERRQKMEELEEQLKKEAPARAVKIRQQIEALLQPEQLKRFRQIELRQEGLWTLLRPDVAEALALTDAQKQQIQEISIETQQKMREAFRDTRQRDANAQPGEDQAGRLDRLQKVGSSVDQIRREGQKKAAKVLNLEQAKKLVELMGEPLGSSKMPFSPRLRSGNKAAGKPAAEKEVSDKAAGRTPSADAKPAETKPLENQPAQKPAADKQ